jgi:hypothetical protein
LAKSNPPKDLFLKLIAAGKYRLSGLMSKLK